MKTLTKKMLNEVTGGGLYDDASLETILEEARKSAIMMKEIGRPYAFAEDMLIRYYSVPGRIEREAIVPAIREVYFG